MSENILNSILFDWSQFGNAWENNFELLHQYTSINGNANILNIYSTRERDRDR